MNSDSIQAILFDMGGTLRTTSPRPEEDRRGYIQSILDLIGSDAPAAGFARLLTRRAAAYKAWADENLVELNEPELWTRWLLPDYPAGQIAPLGLKLNQLWIDANGTRQMLPGAAGVVVELFRRGYRLALVSNTTSSTDAARALRSQQISGCFETIVLSCEFGRKKPHTGMFLEAAARLELPPQACAYVGNDLYKDVSAAHQAGYALAVLVRAHQANTTRPAAAAPHYSVDSLEGLLDLFPARQAGTGAASSPAGSAALSTMWAIHNFPTLQDFCSAASRMGFTHIELNHQVHSGHLEGLDLAGCQVSSVHEPCPADISTETLRNEDWLISAVDEEKRHKGMEAIKRSIDLAARLGAPLVVVHAGNVQADVGLERDLKTLVKTGQRFTEEYERLRERFMHQRRELSGLRLEAVRKSLVELVDYARRGGVTLGLENRYHYMDIPTPDEMETLLQLAPPGRLGFWLDTGHAHALGVLGLVDEAVWTAHFAERIVGIHFHDALGTRDHNAPGRGEIDFASLATRLPAAAQRTLEIRPDVTAVQLKLGIQYLIEKGCLPIS